MIQAHNLVGAGDEISTKGNNHPLNQSEILFKENEELRKENEELRLLIKEVRRLTFSLGLDGETVKAHP